MVRPLWHGVAVQGVRQSWHWLVQQVRRRRRWLAEATEDACHEAPVCLGEGEVTAGAATVESRRSECGDSGVGQQW